MQQGRAGMANKLVLSAALPPSRSDSRLIAIGPVLPFAALA